MGCPMEGLGLPLEAEARSVWGVGTSRDTEGAGPDMAGFDSLGAISHIKLQGASNGGILLESP